jgi:predicted phosphohydrolase
MRIVCVSDTHNQHASLDVPPGDVLVHAGDFSMAGQAREISAFDAWLGTLPHAHKLVIAGNHDWLFQTDPGAARSLLTHAQYLEDSGTVVDGIRFWGSPWQPWFLDWAFNLQRGAEIAAKWALIPDGVDVLVTHGPPHGTRDRVEDGGLVGCEELGRALARVRPRLHVFGHIHEGYGVTRRGDLTFVNASSCDVSYRPINPPVVIDL